MMTIICKKCDKEMINNIKVFKKHLEQEHNIKLDKKNIGYSYLKIDRTLPK